MISSNINQILACLSIYDQPPEQDTSPSLSPNVSSKIRFPRRKIKKPLTLNPRYIQQKANTPSSILILSTKDSATLSPYRPPNFRLKLSKSRTASSQKYSNNKSSPLPKLNSTKGSANLDFSPIQNRRKKGKSLEPAPYLSIKSEISKKNYFKALSIADQFLLNNKDNDVVYYRGLCYMKTGMYSQALEDFRDLYKNYNQTAEVLYRVYKCLIKLEMWTKADKIIGLCEKKFPNSKKTNYYRGKNEYYKKNYEVAVDELRKSCRAKAFLMISNCWKHLKDYEKAVKYLEKHYKNHQDKENYYLAYGKLNYAFKKYDCAIQHLQSSLNIIKNNKTALYYMAKCKFALNDYEDSELILEKIAHKHKIPDLATRAIFKLSNIKLQKNDIYGAFACLKRKRSQKISNNKILHEKTVEGIFEIAQQNFEAAIKIFSEVVELEKRSEWLYRCWNYRAYAHFVLRDFKSSAEDYEKAKKVKELDKASEHNFKIAVVMVKYEEMDYEGALKELDYSFFSQFSNPMWQIIRIYCLIFKDKGNYSSALIELNSVQSTSSEPEFLFLGSILNYLNKKPFKALKQINKCLSLTHSKCYFSCILKGFYNIAMLKHREAYQDFCKAYTLNIDLPNIYPYRALCANYINLSSECFDDILKLLEINDPNAYFLAIYILIISDNIDKALELLNKIQETDDTLLIKAHCEILRENFQEAINLANKVKENNMSNDIYILEGLNEGKVRTRGPGVIFVERYSLWIDAIKEIYQGGYKCAARYFEIIIQFSLKHNDNLAFPSNPDIQHENCETLYNLAICNIFIKTEKSLSSAKSILEEISLLLDGEKTAQLLLLCGIIEMQLNHTLEADEYFDRAKNANSKVIKKFLNREIMHIQPFHTVASVCSELPLIPFPNYDYIMLKPVLKLPSMQCPIDILDTQGLILQILAFCKIQVRPEIPWMKKVMNTYKFTEQKLQESFYCESESQSKKKILKKYKSFVKVNKSEDQGHVAKISKSLSLI
ncbi:hypothetical protein SteCoe_17592 [Stentor coeruleus]|uniref:Uncharacterized protein n=1 Tax=Stentor coeruleus TaxID=5963 RepID=A0A1R2BYH0_9CILI|nr:hypothetical protein SteCoe_17592 [Stentor coeruleus]